MRFIDLFSGIGGFHHALTDLGHECVFACDTDRDCNLVYSDNWQRGSGGDITKLTDLVADHDVLCAGFPCQPFSKSGSQLGFKDKTRGTLFHSIMDIIDNKKPRYVILENVANLENHDNGRTAKIIKMSLDEANYYCYDRVLSPHQFGIPHHRPRYFIVGIHRSVNGYSEFRFPNKLDLECDALSLDDGSDRNNLSEDLQRVLDHWTVFMESLPEGVTPPSPTWSMEFGRSYPLERIHPLVRGSPSRVRLCEILESEGILANPDWPKKEIMALFPPYIRKMKKVIPQWKKGFIRKNRKFWDEYGSELPEGWLEKTREFDETFQKFEWHVGADAERDVMAHMIHTRPSGIRVSRLNWIPALVAIAQIPIIGPWRRRLTAREAARAQSFKDDFKLHEKDSVSFKQLGNSVNVEVVRRVMLGIQDVEMKSDLDVMERESSPEFESFQLDNQ